MKRIIALTLALMMIAALLCACGEEKKADNATEAPKQVTATIEKAYDYGYAEKYAKSVTTDANGNKVYEFEGEAYDNYLHDYSNSISSKISGDLAANHETSYGQFSYIDEDRNAVVVGLNPGQYDETVAAEESKTIAKRAFLYFKGLAAPVNTITVIYCNANKQSEVYGSFEISAE